MIAANEISIPISALLTYEVPDRIQLSNSIMTDQANVFGEQHLFYKTEQRKQTGPFDMLKNTSEYVTFVKLMDLVGNVNHAANVVEKWIFDSNLQEKIIIDY